MDLKTVISDPDYKALPDEEKLKVWMELDPDFKSLPQDEQIKVLRMTEQGEILQAAGAASGVEKRGVIDRFLTGAASEVLGTENQPLSPNVEAQYQVASQNLPNIPGAGIANALIEPSLRNVMGQAQSGNYAGAVGALAGDVFSLGIPQAIDRLGVRRIGPILRNVMNPVEREAMGWARRQGIEQSMGQRTGNRMIQKAEEGLEHKAGSTSRAREFYERQSEQVADIARRMSKQISPVTTSSYEASIGIQKSLTKRVNSLKAKADSLYDAVRKDVTGITVPVITKKREIGPTGYKWTRKIEYLETPVSLSPIRNELRPIYEELNRTFPQGRKEYSKAWSAFKDLMEGDKTMIGAMDFDKYLSAVKSITRDGSSDLLSSKSQGLAKKIIQKSEGEFQAALQTLPTNTAQKLKQARRMVREYHETDEFLLDLGEPGAIYNRLIKGGDRTIDTIKQLRHYSPKDVKVVARTWLEEMIDKATKEGGFSRAAGVMADWNRLTPETKSMLFGPQMSSDLNKFFIAAKRLGHQEGSRTAPILVALGDMGAPVAILAALGGGIAAGQPEAGVGAASAVLATNYAFPNALARILFRPKGPKLLTEILTLKPHTLAFTVAARSLQRLISDVNSSVEMPEQSE